MNAISMNAGYGRQDIYGRTYDGVGKAETHYRIKPRLTYRGGKILEKPAFVSLYLGKYWTRGEGSVFRSKLGEFARALFSSAHMKLWQQYGVGYGRLTGEATIQSKSNPVRISDATLRKRILESIEKGQVPLPDGESVYTVFLPPHTELIGPYGESSRNGMGGYHASFDMPDGRRVYYSAIVYGDGENGVDFSPLPLDNITIAASHEWTEAVTDPDVNNGRLGWYDDVLGEVGDIPIELGLVGSKAYSRIEGFAVQKEWSNVDGRAEVEPLDSRS